MNWYGKAIEEKFGESLPLIPDWPIVIDLDGVPVGKGRARFVRSTGVAFTPAKTRVNESHLRILAQDAMKGRLPIDGPVRVDVVASVPVPRSWSQKKRALALLGLLHPITRPDADNYLKSASDALNNIVIRDDSQIVDARVCKVYSDKPSLRIEVRRI